MITFQTHTLANGLTVILHEDHTTPLATINTLINVGARNEDPSRTGFAHLFEHLMFGGTPRFSDFDAVVTSLGGESNASTNNDFTNFYITLPADNLHQALVLEADRLAGLDFSQRVLDVQKKVVTEEYRQRFLNQPYGDKWLLLRPLAYTVHPYRWSTIGADIAHVQNATVDDERSFFAQHYYPANAIIAIAGNIDPSRTLDMVYEAYGCISSPHGRQVTNLPVEPEQLEQRRLSVERPVPNDAIFIAFPMPHRLHPDFYLYDIISDLLSNGQSSRLFNNLIRQQQLFTSISAYITADRDPGLFLIEGKLLSKVSLQQAEDAIFKQLQLLQNQPPSDYELSKVVNKYQSTFAFSQYRAADRAANLCYYEWLDHIDWVNTDPLTYLNATPDDIQRVAQHLFQPHRASIIHYIAKN